jgi:hypothetical protein
LKHITPRADENDFAPLPFGAELSQFLLYNSDVVELLVDSQVSSPDFVDCVMRLFIANRLEATLIRHCLQRDLNDNGKKSQRREIHPVLIIVGSIASHIVPQ